ncbi:16S rRNA (adenine(1518)-N(6)/adenine(1519)-N(6))-dimethyltransferase RsmA [uncultured Desulfuromusa sp.]|uniref:16S rRNA (adenine(1518)-N(6)/adenine(1519)-N(6))- dimethyltransferase RsmA n=1 Tax=uncultured Desulfuromusa sp. TaxID=219183 RepID=UPI002AA96162|nr:16S rRNA (adenine(1518)-N(6)/adenine(1519)-N(6))-dimethyltransferase RsmA [uncultured Desulfuromusa sp.]
MNYQTKKRFGQHFLHDRTVIDKIIMAAQLDSQTQVVEIGPGLGILTDEMLPRSAHVQVMEIDRDLIERLLARHESRLTVHAGDVLKLPWREFLSHPPYTLVANLPYNISSQIVFRLLEHRDLFQRMVLMFQREVGERLVAAPGGKDYGILSVLTQLWFDMKTVTLVKPGAFNPPPKVDSIVLSFKPLTNPRVAVVDETLFKRVVKGAFTQRRKTLRNSLLASGFDGSDIDYALEQANVNPGCRGETLSLQNFSDLTRFFSQK